MTARYACAEDAPALLSVYAQYIGTPATFETALPSEAEFRARVAEISAFYPYLVLEENGKIVGYAYAYRQMERAAYGWNAELSIYLDGAHLSRGLGKKLYSALLEICALQGIKTVYAGVTLPNPRSEGCTERSAFAGWASIAIRASKTAPGTASPGLKSRFPRTMCRHRPSARSRR